MGNQRRVYTRGKIISSDGLVTVIAFVDSFRIKRRGTFHKKVLLHNHNVPSDIQATLENLLAGATLKEVYNPRSQIFFISKTVVHLIFARIFSNQPRIVYKYRRTLSKTNLK